MDRPIVYPGSLPQDTDFLFASQAAMIAIGWLAEAVLGPQTVISGLQVSPSGGLSLQAAPGMIAAAEYLEATAYGSLPQNVTNTISKIGINVGTWLLGTQTAPTTAGQSVNILVQAMFSEVDASPVVLPYYNAANPALQFNGPFNSGGTQNTRRFQCVALSTVYGVPAATGTQTTPAATGGAVPVAVVSIPYGTVNITSGMISTHPSAPYIPKTLPFVSAVTSPLYLTAAGAISPPPIPAGVTRVRAKIIGGGGGGGGGDGSHAAAGGGAGGFVEATFISTTGFTISGSVGAAGAAGAAGASGGSGTSTVLTINGVTLTATGGVGGAGGVASSAGGTGGSGTGGDLQVTGGAGGDGSSGVNTVGGHGGASALGGGGRASTVTSAVANGVAYGSGGGGVYVTSGAGGSGAGGIIILEY